MRVHQLAPVLSHMNLVHVFPHYISEILSDIFSTICRSSKWLLPFGFSDQYFVFLISPMDATYPIHLIPFWFDHPNNIWLRIEVTKLLIMQFSPSSHSFLPSFLVHPYILFSTLFSNTLSLCSNLDVRSFTPVQNNKKDYIF